MADVIGPKIDDTIRDWQVFQRGADGTVDIPVTGTWGATGTDATMAHLQVRVAGEDDNAAAAPRLDWHDVDDISADGTWMTVLRKVPAGGLYRLETRFINDDGSMLMGDIRHFLGVGDLWIVAGQSNSAGIGKGACFDPPQMGVHMLDNAMRWRIATQPLNDVTDIAHPANREGYPVHGPWLSFAKAIYRSEGIPIGLVQTSLGGSPLSAWDPTDTTCPTPLFDIVKQTVAYCGGRATGVLWYQGETDGDPPMFTTYYDRFCRMVAAWREILRLPELYFVTVQLNRVLDDRSTELQRGWSIVREAQRRAAADLRGVGVIPTLDLPLSDGIHTAPMGNLTLGLRAADAALAEVYGRDVVFEAPQPRAATLIAGGLGLEISFANAAGPLATIDPRSIPFAVEDGNGFVEIASMEIDGSRVLLHLARKVNGKAVLHGAFGNDPAVPLHDSFTMLPMLGFYGLAVEDDSV